MCAFVFVILVLSTPCGKFRKKKRNLLKKTKSTQSTNNCSMVISILKLETRAENGVTNQFDLNERLKGDLAVSTRTSSAVSCALRYVDKVFVIGITCNCYYRNFKNKFCFRCNFDPACIGIRYDEGEIQNCEIIKVKYADTHFVTTRTIKVYLKKIGKYQLLKSLYYTFGVILRFLLVLFDVL